MSGGRLTRNSLVLVAAEAVRRVLSFVVAILIARPLHVEDFGRFGLAMALAGIFGVLANFGLNPLLTRKAAADATGGAREFGTVLGLKFLLGLVAGGAMIALAVVMRYDAGAFLAVVLAAAMIPAEAIETAGIALFDGYQRMAISSLVTLVKAVLLLGLVGIAVLLHHGLPGVMLAYLAGGWLTAAFAVGLVKRVARDATLTPRAAQWWPLAREAAPFMLIGLVWMLAFRVDMVLLQRLAGDGPTGLYRSGYAFFEILLALPILATRALYPALAQGMSEGGEKWRDMLAAAFRIYLLAALPVAIGCALVGDRFVPLFYGHKYAEGGRVVALLGGFLWLWFGTMTLGWSLTAADRLKVVLAGNVLAMTVNIISNLILIPRFSIMGAAASTVISESTLLIYFLVMTRRWLHGLARRAIPWRALPAGAALAATTWLLRDANLALVVAAGAAAYLAAAWLFGALNKSERELVSRLLSRKSG
jgi:O-antigen/teichoic acid export membrane protein